MARDEVAEDDIWVRRPAFAEVDLQCTDVPCAGVVLSCRKVHTEASDDAALREEFADRPPVTR